MLGVGYLNIRSVAGKLAAFSGALNGVRGQVHTGCEGACFNPLQIIRSEAHADFEYVLSVELSESREFGNIGFQQITLPRLSLEVVAVAQITGAAGIRIPEILDLGLQIAGTDRTRHSSDRDTSTAFRVKNHIVTG